MTNNNLNAVLPISEYWGAEFISQSFEHHVCQQIIHRIHRNELLSCLTKHDHSRDEHFLSWMPLNS